MVDQGALQRYIDYWHWLTPESVRALGRVAVPGFSFRDPFNQLVGLGAVEAMLHDMFARLTDPKFEVVDAAISGDTAYLKWIFTAKGWRLEGMSEVQFNADGLALRHVDHWDAAAQVYERLPVIGWVLRFLRRRLGHPSGS